mgnify:CR=1 FL=1
MATNKKITDLTELSEVDLADDDMLAIVDVSAGTTNKVRKSTLASALSGVSSITATTPIAVDSSTGAVVVSTGTIPINKGGTGATAGPAALAALGGISDPTNTRGDIITRGASVLGKVSIGTSTTVLRSDGTDPSWGAVAASELTGTLPIANGGTNATSAGAARTSLGLVIGTNVAAAGSNSDITSITGLTTDLTVAQGGTGASDAAGARSNLSAAALGANSDITSITGLTTDLTVAQGGTGASTFAANGILYGAGTGAVGATAVGTATHVLTSNGAGVAPTFQAQSADFTFVSSAALTTASTISVTGLEAGYDYEIQLEAFAPTTDAQVLWCRMSVASSFLSGASDYAWTSDANTSAANDTADSEIHMTGNQTVGNDAGTWNSFSTLLMNPGGTSESATLIASGMTIEPTPVLQTQQVGGILIGSVAAVDGIQFLWSGGSTFKAQGDITVYRKKRS